MAFCGKAHDETYDASYNFAMLRNKQIELNNSKITSEKQLILIHSDLRATFRFL